MNLVSYKVNDNLYLVNQKRDVKAQKKVVEQPVDHILVIDCSGSMSYDLPKIREQLKKKLPKLLGERDTVSIVWFSGKGEYGILLEFEPVSTLKDLKDVERAIDRWLKPVGLTGFKEPLQEVSKLVEKSSGRALSLFFLSDGCDNQWPRADIVKTLEKVAGKLSAATFVEYGYYADRNLLTAMAEKAGGNLIFSQDFDQYAPSFEASIQKKVVGGKRVEIKVDGDPVGGFTWSMVDGDLITYGIENGDTICVQENVTDVWYLSPNSVGTMSKYDFTKNNGDAVSAAGYAAISLFSVRMKPDVVLPLLKANGDVAFIERFGGLFGKQRYSEFMELAKEAAFDTSKRFTKGCDPSRIPRDDAFTVLDMLTLLESDEENRILLDHEKFQYNRISRAKIDASEVLTKEEQEEIAALTEEMGKTKNAKRIAELSAKIAEISNKPTPLVFTADSSPDGYEINSLTYNEQQPNVSFMVRKTGHVDISARTPDALKKVLPTNFPTFIFRNYAVVKDGLVNIKLLPTKLSEKTLKKLFELNNNGLLGDNVVTSENGVILLNIGSLPVINRKMVKSVSAKKLFTEEWELLKIQAEQKVYKSYAKEKALGKKSEGFIELYGQDAADWLKEQGFTDYSGFSPKSVQAESKDFYVAKELNVKVKSFSSIPSLNDFRKQVTKGKLTPSAQLMEKAVQDTESYLNSPEFQNSGNAGLEKWLKAREKALDVQRRQMLRDKAQQVFSIIVGLCWPVEFKSIDEDSMNLQLDNKSLEFKLEMTEKEIRI